MDQDTRNKLQRATQQVRRILEEEFAEQLEGTFDVLADGTIAAEPGAHLDATQRLIRQKLVQAIGHLESSGKSTKEAIKEYLRQAAFTILNRFVALRMLEARDLLQECVSKGDDSSGFKEFCGLAPGLSALPDDGYRLYLECLCDELTVEIKVLFDRRDPTTLLWPRRSALTAMLDVLAQPELANVWAEDETIGWVYQYFNGDEERTQMRAESQAPRNSRELAVRNQFFTPRYVVQFLTDNTLGRTWYEMMQGATQLAHLDYLVRRPDEVFLAPSTSEGHQNFDGDCATIVRQLQSGNAESFPGFTGETENQIQRMIQLAHCVSAYDQLGERAMEWFETIRTLNERDTESLLTRNTGEILNYLFMTCRADRHGGDGTVYAEPWFAAAANEVRRRSLQQDDDSQEHLLKRPVYIPHRAKKDPRDLRILDPACGSGHFLLYTFDLLITIYEEAWADAAAAAFTETGTQLRADYESIEDLRRAMPELILRHNLHGVDIDPRAAQIAALALWMRAQRAYNQFEVDRAQRPPITKTNIVVAEPMPGDAELVDEFAASLKPAVLGDLFKKMVEEMKLAGELGSLLKIEESIAKAVKEAEEAHHEDGMFAEKIESQNFWDTADEKIIAALGSFAESAAGAGGVRRQLFAGDAAQGVAFIELMRKRFDAVLMNPPFGDSTVPSRPYIRKCYSLSRNDLYATFVDRCSFRLASKGILGAITSRTGLFLKSFVEWRREVLLNRLKPVVVADLGLGVMDQAAVEAAAYCLSNDHESNNSLGSANDCSFFNLKGSANKACSISESIDNFNGGLADENTHLVCPQAFGTVPNAPFAYWVDRRTRDVFRSLPPFESNGRTARGGAKTLDDFRFIRTVWEVPQEGETKHHGWFPFAKGGAFSLYFADIYLVVRWSNKGRELRAFYENRSASESWGGFARSEEFYFRRGITWPRRTDRASFRCLPSGCIFSEKGSSAFVLGDSESELFGLLGLMNSKPFRHLIGVQTGAAEVVQTFEIGVIRNTPVPPLSEGSLAESTREAVRCKQRIASCDETSNIFLRPSLLLDRGPTLRDSFENFILEFKAIQTRYSALNEQIDREAWFLYRFEQSVMRKIIGSDEKSFRDDREIAVCSGTQISSHVEDVLSFSIGCVFGRWDVHNAINEEIELPSPFAIPGTYSIKPPPLDNPEKTSKNNKIAVFKHVVMCDDIGHSDDVVVKICRVLDDIWDGKGHDICDEAGELLGQKYLDIRNWMRDRFFVAHIKRYSKSRRKAPIYWQLATPSASYSVWCYYHRLTRDTFFRVANGYVAPKVNHEERKLNTLRQEAGPDPSSKQRKEIDAQETFVAELRAFLTEVKRIAPLWNPNLNDGVIINFAPLWRLVPQHKAWQKECKKCWDKLVKGEYDWAHLAMHLWPERVVPKCQDDRSLAIAHGLEDVFWYEDKDEKWEKRKPPEGGWEPVVKKLVDERSRPGVKAALASLLEAPTPGGSTTGTKRRRKAGAS